MQGALIQSLVGELRFHMPYGIAEKKKKKEVDGLKGRELWKE